MAVSVIKLQGNDIPEDLRGDPEALAFKVTDEDGSAHYTRSEEEAARLAVELSERAKRRD